MSKIIGVLNFKGGTGKTTTVVNLADGLARQGQRVLCVDLDSQGSLAAYLDVEHTRTLADLLLGQAAPEDCILSVSDNLDLIPSDEELLQAEGELWRMDDNQQARRVVPEKMNGLNGYDYILLDYSPSASLLSESALLYVREIIVPISMDYMALMGTRQVLKTLKTIGRIPEHRVRLTLVVPTFYYGWQKKDQEVLETLQRYFGDKVAEPIRKNVKISEAAGHHKSIYDYAPSSHGAVDYARLVERVMANE
jgi:chromosome partitioning protein